VRIIAGYGKLELHWGGKMSGPYANVNGSRRAAETARRRRAAGKRRAE
jgi:hypothetical protein